MTEDDEDKRISRRKSNIKGPFIQNEGDSAKPQKPIKEDSGKAENPPAPAQEGTGQVTAKPEKTEPQAQKPEPKSTGAGKEEMKVRHGKPVMAGSEPKPETKKDKKKREREEKRVQVATVRETRKKERIAIAEAKRESRKRGKPTPVKVKAKQKKSATPAKTKKPSEKSQGTGQKIPGAAAEKAAEEKPVTAAGTGKSFEAESGTESVKEESTPVAGYTSPGEDDTGAFGFTETPEEETGELSAEEKEARKFKKGVPVVAEKAAHVETKKEKRKREKEEKRKQVLIERQSRKKEVTPKIQMLKSAPREDAKKRLESGVPAKKTELAQTKPESEEGKGAGEEERVSRFSLKKFVTAYRDRQSVIVRQAEIKRFQSALFPRVMARKWQTSITPSVELPSQAIELPAVPLHMKLGLFFFRNFYSKRQNNDKLETALRKAKMPYSAIQYYSMITIVAILSILVGLIGISVFALVTGIFLWYAYLALGGLVGLGALLSLNSPQSLVNKRKKDIDSKLPMALAYIATMASADVPVETIMHELGKSYEYGEVAKEARAISASSRLFGNDIVTALREESKYSPSLKFAEFLQGITSTVTSGGNLKDYFTMKAVQFQSELSTVIRANAESVGVLAESYVTVGVAFPLMLLVILGVMAALSPSGGAGLTLVLYLIVLAIIPAITFMFTFLVSSTVKEVDV